MSGGEEGIVAADPAVVAVVERVHHAGEVLLEGIVRGVGGLFDTGDCFC